MLGVNVVAHQNSVEFSVLLKQLQLANSLAIARHVNFLVHLKVRALQTKEVVLTVTAEIRKLEQLVVVHDGAWNAMVFEP
jgi:hypothetical protein